MSRFPFLLLLAAGTSGAVFAAENRPFAAPELNELPATGAGSLVQVTLALAIVLAAVFAAAWLMQRVKSFGGSRSGVLKVVTSVALGPKERAVLVQLGSEQLLLGVAAGQVNTLHVLAAPLAGQDGPASPVGASPAGQSPEVPTFKALLRKSLGLS